ncbi:hypothetical protein ACJJTC_014490 [Scirpophaga incertulas]
MVGLFEEFMLLLFDHHAPVKIISIKPDKSFPWVTETLKQMMHLRNQALRVYRATKSESDKTSWKDLQVMVRTSLDAEKRAFFNHFVNSQVQNGKTFWKSLQLRALAIPSQESTLPYNLNDPNTINLHFLDVQCGNSSPPSTLSFYNSALNVAKINIARRTPWNFPRPSVCVGFVHPSIGWGTPSAEFALVKIPSLVSVDI